MIHRPIVHIVQRYPPALGGAESYFARLSRFLAQNGQQVEVHTSNALDLEAFWSPYGKKLPAGTTIVDGVPIHRHAIRYFPGRKIILKALSMLAHPTVQGLTLPASPQMPSLLSKANAKNIRLVHASAFPYTFPLFAGLTWAKRADVPYFLTPFLHLGDPDNPYDHVRRSFLGPSLQHLLRQADLIFVQTKLEQDAVLAQGIAQDKVILQGLGVDPGECTGGDRERASQRWNLPSDELLCIGHLANLSEEKGTNDLLRALIRLQEWGIAYRCLLAGPQMPNFRRFWKSVPSAVRQRVHLLGALAERDKPDFYSAVDLFALPSRSDSFGLVLLEAWANGIPCIGYRAGGIAEVIAHQETGLLIPCGDVTSLAASLQQLIEDDELRGRLGQEGRNRTLRDNRWPDKLAIVRRAYDSLA
jgi:glycosyltransferase involved in cell wall biosynthesis